MNEPGSVEDRHQAAVREVYTPAELAWLEENRPALERILATLEWINEQNRALIERMDRNQARYEARELARSLNESARLDGTVTPSIDRACTPVLSRAQQPGRAGSTTIARLVPDGSHARNKRTRRGSSRRVG